MYLILFYYNYLFQKLDNLFREQFLPDPNTSSGLSHGNKSTDTSSSNDDDDDDDEIDTNQVVNHRVSQLLENQCDMNNDLPDEENTEEENPGTEEDLNSFKCNCLNNCFEKFNATKIRDHIYRLREMTKDEKEMLIMGSIKHIGNKKITSKAKENKRLRYDFSFQGQSIC